MLFLSISSTILLFISGFGIVQAILLACLIYFHPKTDRNVSSFLALYIFCWCIPMFLPFVLHFSSWQNGIFLEAFPFLLGPLLYLYVRSFKEAITWRNSWPHFLLFIIFFLLDCGIYLAIADKYPRSSQLPTELIINPGIRVRIGIRVAQMLVYFFLARKSLASYQKSIRILFSETSRINLAWMSWLINGYLVLVVAIIAVYFLVVQFPEEFDLITLINVTLVTPYIYIITFKGITQPTIWQVQPNVSKEKVEEEMQQAEEIVTQNAKRPRSPKPSLNAEKTDELTTKITALMEKDKLYQETELTLHQLADRLQVPTYQVSYAINEGMNKNFYDLINEYRVEQAKRLLADPRHNNYTILSVGFEAGFNSKTTFNTVFKKVTGFTPTEFREQQKSVLSTS